MTFNQIIQDSLSKCQNLSKKEIKELSKQYEKLANKPIEKRTESDLQQLAYLAQLLHQ